MEAPIPAGPPALTGQHQNVSFTPVMSHNVLLFPELEKDLRETRTTGILPSQRIQEFIRDGAIRAYLGGQEVAVLPQQIQPASMDLRLGSEAHRVRASFLPGELCKVEAKISDLGMTTIDLMQGAVFEKNCTYIVSVMEELFLAREYSGKANPKSTTGRLDIFTRLITDFGTEFESVPQGYRGKLFVEVVPRTFSIRVQQGMRLNQLRFIRLNPRSPSLEKIQEKDGLSYSADETPVRDPELISVDLRGGEGIPIVGYKARNHAPLIDLNNVDYYDPEEFWEPITPRKRIILDPGDFYLLISKEKVEIPPNLAGVMTAIDPSMGEFRIHYAGFFDPGFGYNLARGKGTRAVLEVRSHEVPFVIEHGQMVGRLEYKHLMGVPDKLYGAGIGSSYQAQGLSLSKQFKRLA